jgi:predicted RNA binding protein YcfA (HicA-like mRNA interferase family)
MPTREKRLQRARNNPKNVSFQDLCSILQDHGCEIKSGKGSHHVARLPGTSKKLTFPKPTRGPMKPVYVEMALGLIDEILEALE